jgi:hypothetical protein
VLETDGGVGIDGAVVSARPAIHLRRGQEADSGAGASGVTSEVRDVAFRIAARVVGRDLGVDDPAPLAEPPAEDGRRERAPRRIEPPDEPGDAGVADRAEAGVVLVQ